MHFVPERSIRQMPYIPVGPCMLALFFLSWIEPLTCDAQYRLNHLSVLDGLSQNSVNDIFQDSQGFLWFATQDGLNRFDGYDFEIFSVESEISLLENFVWGITEDRHGNIWVASRYGGTRLDLANGRSTHFVITEDYSDPVINQDERQVLDFQQTEDSMLIYFGPRALMVGLQEGIDKEFVVGGALFQENEFMGNWYNSLVHISKRGKKEFKFFGNHARIDEHIIPYPPGYVISTAFRKVLEFKDGFLIGTSNGLLYMSHAGQIEIISCIGLGVTDVSEIDEDIWVATGDGIYILSRSDLSCQKHLGREQGFSSDVILTISKSSDGLIWVGTGNQGMDIYDPLVERIQYTNEEHGLPGGPVWAIAENELGMWYGTEKGLHLIDDQGAREVGPFAEHKITTLHFLDDLLLAGTTSGELWSSRDFKNWDRVAISSLSISGIAETTNYLWVSSHFGLYRSRKDTLDFQRVDDLFRLPATYFLSLYSDRGDNLWVGGNLGSHRISQQDVITNYLYQANQTESSPANQFITGYYEDKMGHMWMTTYGGGVSILDPATGNYHHLSKKDGLGSNSCSAILGAGTEVWVSHHAGLSRINEASFQVANFNTDDGLIAREFALGSAYLSNSGTMYFGAVSGAVHLQPDAMTVLPPVPRPGVTGISINYDQVYRDIRNELSLFPGERIFSLKFSQNSFRKRDHVHYEYTMEGFDDGWASVTPAARTATYSLRPGNYTFLLRTTIDDRKSDLVSLNVQVYPAIYQTWWFLTLIIFTGLITIVFMVRYVSHQQLRARLRKMELQQKIQYERERISRDLHDNVGSQITYLATSLDNLSNHASKAEMEELGQYARDTMRHLRETIWVINQDVVSLSELKNKVISHMAQVLKSSPGIRSEVNLTGRDQVLNPNLAINIYRLIQEAVNNAIKHANPTKIEVSINSYSEELDFDISDDGVGFDGLEKDGHFGLINMKTRALEIGTKLSIESKTGKGTRINFRGVKIGQMT